MKLLRGQNPGRLSQRIRRRKVRIQRRRRVRRRRVHRRHRQSPSHLLRRMDLKVLQTVRKHGEKTTCISGTSTCFIYHDLDLFDSWFFIKSKLQPLVTTFHFLIHYMHNMHADGSVDYMMQPSIVVIFKFVFRCCKEPDKKKKKKKRGAPSKSKSPEKNPKQSKALSEEKQREKREKEEQKELEKKAKEELKKRITKTNKADMLS